MNVILANIAEPAAETMLKLTKIAIKAHGNNPSPVDIKVELAELNMEQLLQIEEDITRSLQAYKEVSHD